MIIRPSSIAELESCYKLELHYSSESPAATTDGFFLPQTEFSLYEGLAKDGYIRVAMDDLTGQPGAFILSIPPGHAIVQRLLTNKTALALFDGPAPDPDKTVWIAKVATWPEFRRKGYAKALYDQMFSDFAGNSVMTATALSPLRNFASEDFHRSLGMKSCGVFLGGNKGHLQNVVNTVWTIQL